MATREAIEAAAYAVNKAGAWDTASGEFLPAGSTVPWKPDSDPAHNYELVLKLRLTLEHKSYHSILGSGMWEARYEEAVPEPRQVQASVPYRTGQWTALLACVFEVAAAVGVMRRSRGIT